MIIVSAAGEMRLHCSEILVLIEPGDKVTARDRETKTDHNLFMDHNRKIILDNGTVPVYREPTPEQEEPDPFEPR